MMFRTRVLLALIVAGLLPVLVLGVGVRSVMTDRLVEQSHQRVQALVSVIVDDLERQRVTIGERLAVLRRTLSDDNRFRLAAVQDVLSERTYLLDYATEAMRLSGLSMLQLQDELGVIVSSGHFRNEYGRREPGVSREIAASPDGLAVVTARTPEGEFLVLARTDSVRIGGRSFTMIGGVSLEREFLNRLARDEDLAVSYVYDEGVLSSNPQLEAAFAVRIAPEEVAAEVALPYVSRASSAEAAVDSRLVITQSLAPLTALRQSINTWIAIALVVTGLSALALAGLLSDRLARPLTTLARKTAGIDVDRLDVDFDSNRKDEIGQLSRVLGAMTERLRVSAVKLRSAERRATVGDLARQLNHDIKNGLMPIRNVIRHLTQVAASEPGKLAEVFGERRATVESSMSYLENLASNYARLSPKVERQPCDLNVVVHQAVHAIGVGRATVELALAQDLPAVLGDPISLRRIVENLVGNAIDSLESTSGTVMIGTDLLEPSGEASRVRLTVVDAGQGMSAGELERAFEDFYTTKTGGSGLGLPIVRRLVLDLNGSLRVESEPGVGTRCIVELPVVDRVGGW